MSQLRNDFKFYRDIGLVYFLNAFFGRVCVLICQFLWKAQFCLVRWISVESLLCELNMPFCGSAYAFESG